MAARKAKEAQAAHRAPEASKEPTVQEQAHQAATGLEQAMYNTAGLPVTTMQIAQAIKAIRDGIDT